MRERETEKRTTKRWCCENTNRHLTIEYCLTSDKRVFAVRKKSLSDVNNLQGVNRHCLWLFIEKEKVKITYITV